jgi:hypothetical protein
MLLDILRRLPPRSLATSRCVCRAWRTTVDEHRLLRADLLPLSLDGVIYQIPRYPGASRLFSRRSTACKITSSLCESLSNSSSSLFVFPGDNPDLKLYWAMYDCCNGLVLLHCRVVNPATRQYARLPFLSSPCACYWCSNHYLLYDPTVSPHYEVLLVPHLPGHNIQSSYMVEVEWPPSPYIFHVFSSKTKCWTERSFMREGDAAVSGLKIVSSMQCESYHSAYSLPEKCSLPCQQTLPCASTRQRYLCRAAVV